MDHGDNKEWAEDRESLVLGSFEYIRAMLVGLPVPIEIPDLVVDGDVVSEGMLGLQRAHDLMDDEPMSSTVRTAYQRLISDWFTAYEMLTLIRLGGPAPWRLDAVENTLIRLRLTLYLIESGEVEKLDES